MITKATFSIYFLFVFSFFIWPYASAQTDINAFYRQSDPAREIAAPELKMQAHQKFYQKAIADRDSFQVILGAMYLSNDLIIASDYRSAMEKLIIGANYAEALNDTLWLGRINHKKGTVHSLMSDYSKAIKYYNLSLAQSSQVQDSQYLAITLEQLGAMLSYQGEFERSNEYYQQAIPLVERFWQDKALATTLANYGNALSEQGNNNDAIKAYKRSLQVSKRIGDEYRITPCKQNLATVYEEVDSLDLALQLYRECKTTNEKNGWYDFLFHTYQGLANTHDKLNHLDSAIYYLRKYYTLKDSIMGAHVQTQINDLSAENELQKKDITLLQQQATLQASQRNARNVLFSASLFVLLAGAGIGFLLLKKRKDNQLLQESRKGLLQITKILQHKNAELRDLKNELAVPNTAKENASDPELEEINFYEMKILTDADWDSFKSQFEKAYPKFLQKIRNTFPDISEAEERLFLFIKLHLTSRESADILGIQPSTIKKTRSRLRKRMGLDTKYSLETFIHNFDKTSPNASPGSSV